MIERSDANAIIEQIIGDYIDNYTSSKMELPLWQKPIVRFAKANDPLFWELKQVVSKSHATPIELLPGAKSVVVYFIPFIKEIPKSNKSNKVASEVWASAYVETNKLIVALNDHLAEKLVKFGFLSKVLPPAHNFNTETLISDWSHKHVAPAAIILVNDKGLTESGPLLDLGAAMQNICLAALSFGLGTCIEDQGILYPAVVRELANIPDTKRIVISIAIGYPNEEFPANQLTSDREPVENISTWVGF